MITKNVAHNRLYYDKEGQLIEQQGYMSRQLQLLKNRR